MTPKPTIASIKITNKLAVAKSFTIIIYPTLSPTVSRSSKSYAKDKGKYKLLEIK